MSSPCAASIFLALITGGMKAPSEGKPNTTMVTLADVCEAAGTGLSATKASAARAQPAARISADNLVI
jgi:hypothetical protein